MSNYLAAGAAQSVVMLQQLKDTLGDTTTPAVSQLLDLSRSLAAHGPQAATTAADRSSLLSPTPQVRPTDGLGTRLAAGRAGSDVVTAPAGPLPGEAGAQDCPPITYEMAKRMQDEGQALADATPHEPGQTPAGFIFFALKRPDGQCCIQNAPFNDPQQFTPGTVVYEEFEWQGEPAGIGKALANAYAIWNVPEGLLCGEVGTPPITPPPPPPPPPSCPTSPCVIDVTCPPPVINIPPCPPSTGVLPDCVMIDLCDWDKLCSILRDCLKAVKTEPPCDLDNDSAWAYKDCDGTFTTDLKSFMGSYDGGLTSEPSLDDAFAKATADFLTLTDLDFSRGDVPDRIPQR
jgi:hypothetical protein